MNEGFSDTSSVLHVATESEGNKPGHGWCDGSLRTWVHEKTFLPALKNTVGIRNIILEFNIGIVKKFRVCTKERFKNVPFRRKK